jgi:hypothetical protein
MGRWIAARFNRSVPAQAVNAQKRTRRGVHGVGDAVGGDSVTDVLTGVLSLVLFNIANHVRHGLDPLRFVVGNRNPELLL